VTAAVPDQYLLIDVADEDGVVTMKVAGEIDIANWTDLHRAFDRVLRRDPPTTEICVDMAAVSFLDSNGVAALLTARSRAHADGTRFRVTATSLPLRRLFEITGLMPLLTQGNRLPGSVGRLSAR
jgi:anti-anti-sigma factor